jgi:hypothetical protein
LGLLSFIHKLWFQGTFHYFFFNPDFLLHLLLMSSVSAISPTSWDPLVSLIQRLLIKTIPVFPHRPSDPLSFQQASSPGSSLLWHSRLHIQQPHT